MYLPSFYKTFNELNAFRAKRYSGFAIPIVLWSTSIYKKKIKQIINLFIYKNIYIKIRCLDNGTCYL